LCYRSKLRFGLLPHERCVLAGGMPTRLRERLRGHAMLSGEASNVDWSCQTPWLPKASPVPLQISLCCAMVHQKTSTEYNLGGSSSGIRFFKTIVDDGKDLPGWGLLPRGSASTRILRNNDKNPSKQRQDINQRRHRALSRLGLLARSRLLGTVIGVADRTVGDSGAPALGN